jgi:hypothetical protein
MSFPDNEIQVKIDLSHGQANSSKRSYGQIADELMDLLDRWSGKAKIRLNIGSYRSDNVPCHHHDQIDDPERGRT